MLCKSLIISWFLVKQSNDTIARSKGFAIENYMSLSK